MSQANTRLACQPALRIGHARSDLLVPGRDVPDRVPLVIEGVHEPNVGGADDPVDLPGP